MHSMFYPQGTLVYLIINCLCFGMWNRTASPPVFIYLNPLGYRFKVYQDGTSPCNVVYGKWFELYDSEILQKHNPPRNERKIWQFSNHGSFNADILLFKGLPPVKLPNHIQYICNLGVCKSYGLGMILYAKSYPGYKLVMIYIHQTIT